MQIGSVCEMSDGGGQEGICKLRTRSLEVEIENKGKGGADL